MEWMLDSVPMSAILDFCRKKVSPRVAEFGDFEHVLLSLHVLTYHMAQQEAQLSQRGRAMLRVIEYFAKSLKVSQGHSK